MSQRKIFRQTVTIANGAALSSAIIMQGDFCPVAIWVPTLDGTNLEIQVSKDGTTYGAASDGTGAIVRPTIAGYYIALSQNVLIQAEYLKLKSTDGAGTGVNQTAARSIDVDIRLVG